MSITKKIFIFATQPSCLKQHTQLHYMSSDTSNDMQRGFCIKEVHNAIKNIDKGLSTGICKIVPIINQDEDYCLIMHADGAGTKSSLAYVLEKKVIYQYGRDCPRCINHEY
jgi:hypothetical protein